MACGEIGLATSYYYSLTQRQLYNIVNGYRKKEDYLSRERWQIARKMMYSAIAPYAKDNFKETDILEFPWEKELLNKISKKEHEEMLKKIKISEDFFGRYDANKSGIIPQA